ncbi:MAG: alpha/beta hydrolase [Sphingobium sp.]
MTAKRTRRPVRLAVKAGLIAIAIGGASTLVAQRTSTAPAASARTMPQFALDGTVHVPAFDLPPSSLASAEALAEQKARAGAPAMTGNMAEIPIAELRATVERYMAPLVAKMKARYAVDVVAQQIGGVPTRIVTPRGGEADPSRILINLHGGGFMVCADGCGLLESMPIAAVGRYRVVTVDYRQGPENVFPAASQDVASVYNQLLKSYRPENIGIYGCSAGGLLTAQSVAWFVDKSIPLPGAVGIFGAGGVRFGSGDSGYVAAYTDGTFPPPGPDGSSIPTSYFKGTDMRGPLVSPAAHLDVAAKFPPTLIITGTRAMDMSPAIYTNNQLLKAGARSNLIVGEAMGHCHIYNSALPEARDAYDQIVRFFDANLGSGGKGRPVPAQPSAAIAPRDRPARRESCLERTEAMGNSKFAFRKRKKDCVD